METIYTVSADLQNPQNSKVTEKTQMEQQIQATEPVVQTEVQATPPAAQVTLTEASEQKADTSTSAYYLGIDDIKHYRTRIKHGRKERVELDAIIFCEREALGDPSNFEETRREFSRKFYKTPKEALINVFFQKGKDSRNKELVEKFLKELEYDESEHVYRFTKYRTLKTYSDAKPSQVEKFKLGLYELIEETHDIQVLKTEVCDEKLI